MALRRAGQIELFGVKYDVARNGEHYHLVANKLDAYDRPCAVQLILLDLQPGDKEIAYALLDVVGELLDQIAGFELARERKVRGGSGAAGSGLDDRLEG